MATVHELLDANLFGVFNNRDAADRRRVIDETYTDDVEFTDPEGTAVGRDALDEKAGDLLATAPADFEFVTDGIHYESAETGALPWAFGPAGSPVVRGLDIVTVRDGRISGLRTLLVEITEPE
ncbi:nuclear transport factor 2 family protein [Agreia sp. Leaf283]|uniref:nuclear transport factor 2 family protein n=1 Tax=Agreia sp. Leaf283 TaxID=1736321 RepID=UPI0006F84C8F|nr:nuclear transport factor 2 family protein [Agreia sp. Leaf283]KQP53863.1 hypothetical protein ASF51_17145 [Agreia sp. Leaf283]